MLPSSSCSVDQIATFLLAPLVLRTTWHLGKQVFDVLMEKVPEHIDHDDVYEALKTMEGVEAVHDLHIWSLSVNVISLSAHLNLDGKHRSGEVLRRAQKLLGQRFDIWHTTLQCEETDDNLDCYDQ